MILISNQYSGVEIVIKYKIIYRPNTIVCYIYNNCL